LPHVEHPRKARLAQRIGGEYRPLFVRRRHWERLAKPFGIDAEAACGRVRSLAERLPDALADVVRHSDLSSDERRVANVIRDRIAAWAGERVRDLI
jgi:hypothetical protein